METIWIKINTHLKKVGVGVENFSYIIKFDGIFWSCEVEGMSIDGEEQYFSFDGADLYELYEEIKKDF